MFASNIYTYLFLNLKLFSSSFFGRFYLRGACKFGINCNYSHQISKDVNRNRNDSTDSLPICRNYQQGVCKYGHLCFYRHVKDDNNKSESNQSDNDYGLCEHFDNPVKCPNGDRCTSIHGEVCDICNQFCLIKGDKKQQQSHKTQCLRNIELEKKEASAAKLSSKKCCGICMEVVWEKEAENDRKFGILENCDHTFCLTCIRKWRELKSYEHVVVKSCPECRVKSDFITPNKYWFSDAADKTKIISEYKKILGYIIRVYL
jgi:E3 ubiquitin-protein ligase makorin